MSGSGGAVVTTEFYGSFSASVRSLAAASESKRLSHASVSVHNRDVSEQTHDFLSLSTVAERLGVSQSRVRRLIEDRYLAAKQIDREPRVPDLFLDENEPVAGLRGTIILLEDTGFALDEAVDWVLAENELLGEAPISALRKGHKAPVRRAVQSLA